MRKAMALIVAAFALSLCIVPMSALAADQGSEGGSLALTTQAKPSSGDTYDLKSATITAIPDQEYTGAELKPTVQVSIAGVAIDPSNLEITYQNNINAGTAKVTVRGLDKKKYKGNASASFVIKPKAITPTVTLSAKKYVFNGEIRTPEVTVKDGTAVLESGKDYTATLDEGRINVGIYKVAVVLKGNYAGNKTVKFKIVPKRTSIVKVTPLTRGFKVTWKKQATKMATARITGYQVQYSTKSNFSTKKAKTIKGYAKTYKKVTKLKAKKKYYVRIRTYKTIDGKRLYSSWSKKKAVTTK